MSMFCGFPVIVAVLPMFEAVATASRWGMGGNPRRCATCSTNGVITRQTMSLTRNAESRPLVKITVANPDTAVASAVSPDIYV